MDFSHGLRFPISWAGLSWIVVAGIITYYITS
jgi:hypothetical protein